MPEEGRWTVGGVFTTRARRLAACPKSELACGHVARRGNAGGALSPQASMSRGHEREIPLRIEVNSAPTTRHYILYKYPSYHANTFPCTGCPFSSINTRSMSITSETQPNTADMHACMETLGPAIIILLRSIRREREPHTTWYHSSAFPQSWFFSETRLS